jgi:hypothetical protein
VAGTDREGETVKTTTPQATWSVRSAVPGATTTVALTRVAPRHPIPRYVVETDPDALAAGWLASAVRPMDGWRDTFGHESDHPYAELADGSVPGFTVRFTSGDQSEQRQWHRGRSRALRVPAMDGPGGNERVRQSDVTYRQPARSDGWQTLHPYDAEREAKRREHAYRMDTEPAYAAQHERKGAKRGAAIANAKGAKRRATMADALDRGRRERELALVPDRLASNDT